MPNDVAISLRLPQELLDRAERLIPYLAANKHMGSRVSRAVAIREALMRGLDELEEEQAVRRHVEQEIAGELKAGESIVDVATKHRRHGFRVADVERVQRGLSQKKKARRRLGSK